MIFELAQHFRDTLEALPREHPKHGMLELLEEAIRRDIHFIDRHPTTLFQCMWNTCWRDTAGRADDTDARGAGPGDRRARTDAATGSALVSQWWAAKSERTPGFMWVRSLRPLPMPGGDGQTLVLRGHTNPVQSVDFSPDGTQLASGSAHLAPPKPFDPAVPIYYGGSVSPVLAEPVENPFPTVDNSLRIWDTDSGREIACCDTGDEPITSVSCAPDGSRVAAASQAGTIVVLDVFSGVELARCVGHRGAVNRAVFSPDGRWIASGSSDCTIGLWDAATGTEIRTLLGHQSSVMGVAFSPDGTQVASASASPRLGDGDHTVRVWDLATGQQQLSFNDPAGILCVAFSPDGCGIAAGTLAGTIRVWQLADRTEIARLEGHRAPVASVAYSPDGRHLVTASLDGTIREWSTQDWRQESCLTGHQDAVNCAVVAPDGKRIASGSADSTVRLWGLAPSRPAVAMPAETDVHGGDITCLSLTLDGRFVVTGAQDGSVAIWNSSGDSVSKCLGHPSNLIGAAILPASDLVLSVDCHSIRACEFPSGREHYVIAVEKNDLTAFALSPDRQIAACGSWDGSVRVWHAVSGEPIAELHAPSREIRPTAFSPALLQAKYGPTVRCLDISRDGVWLATGHEDGSVQVWSVRDGTWLGHRGHRRAVSSVRFSPDGRYLASGEEGGAVLLWDRSSGQPPEGLRVCAYRGHEGRVRAIAFSDGGDVMVTAAKERTVIVCDLSDGLSMVLEGFAEAAALAGRRARWWPVVRGLETMFIDSETGVVAALFPVVFDLVVSDQVQSKWFAAEGSHFYMLAFEADENEVVMEVPVRSEIRQTRLLASARHPVEALGPGRQSGAMPQRGLARGLS